MKHGLAAIPEAGGLDGGRLEGAANLVHHEGGQRFAFDVFRDDQEWLAALRDLFQQGKQVLQRRDLLLVDEDVGILQNGFHALGVRHEIRGQVALVELHAFDNLERRLDALGLFDGDGAVVADLLHGLGDDLADLAVAVRGNRRDLADDLIVILYLLAHLGKLLDDTVHSLLDATLERHRVGPGGHIAQSFAVDRFGKHGCRRRAVAGHVGGLGSHFLDHLGAHVLVLVFQLDFLGNRHTVLGHGGGAPFLVQNHIAALGTKRRFDRAAELGHTGEYAPAGIFTELKLLSTHFLVSFVLRKRPGNEGSRGTILLLDDRQHVVFAHDDVLVAVNLDFGARILAHKNAVALFHFHGNALTIFIKTARTDGHDFALLGLLFGRIRNDDSAPDGLTGFLALDENTVCKRTHFHCFFSLLRVHWTR